MNILRITRPVEFQQEIPTNKGAISIGRSPDNEVMIDLPDIAAVHASILEGNILIDHSSESGTFVNGIRVSKKRLAAGDLVRLGSQLEFLYEVRVNDKCSDGHGEPLDETADEPISDIKKRITLEEAGFEYDSQSQIVPERPLKAGHLAAIYQVNQAITEIFDMDELTQKILRLICQIFSADRAAVILFDQEAQGLTPVALLNREDEREIGLSNISETTIRRVISEKTAILAMDTWFDERFRDVSSIMRKQIRSVMCVPLHTKGKVLGALYADTIMTPRGFTEDDLELLFAVGGALANSIENIILVDRIREEERKLNTLGRYLPSTVVDQLFGKMLPAELGGKYATVSVLFADIRGFTQLAENADPADIVSLLNHYFSSMSEIIFEYGGTLGEYIGDEIMAYFGAPRACADHVKRAVSVAVKMKQKMRRIRQEWERTSRPLFDIGIGIATGNVIAGNIGSEKQMKYTIIGSTVNLASRLCARAKAGQILISPDPTLRKSMSNLQFRETVYLKGLSSPIEIFEVP